MKTKKIRNSEKVVVLDMDETIVDLTIYYSIYESIAKIKGTTFEELIDRNSTFQLLDLYPELFRPRIFDFFKHLVKLKKEGRIKVTIYTNNQSSKESIQLIVDYINNKVKYPLIGNFLAGVFHYLTKKKIEKGRKSINKSIKELVSCKIMNKNDKVFFVDDSYYKEMEKAYYFHIAHYKCHLSYQNILSRLMKSSIIYYFNLEKSNEIPELLKTELEGHKITCNYYEPNCTIIDNANIYKELMKNLLQFLKTPVSKYVI